MRKFYRSNIIALLVAIPIYFLAAGCTTPESDLARVDQARQTYVASLKVIAPLLEQGAFKGEQSKLDAIYYTKNEVRDFLNDAETAAISGQKLSVSKLLDRALAALDRLLILKYEVKAAARRKGIKSLEDVGVVNPSHISGTTRVVSFPNYQVTISLFAAAKSAKGHIVIC